MQCYAQRVICADLNLPGGEYRRFTLAEVVRAVSAQEDPLRWIAWLQFAWDQADALLYAARAAQGTGYHGILPVPCPPVLAEALIQGGKQERSDVLTLLYYGALPGDGLARRDVESGVYEVNHQLGPGDIVIDVGAHVGFFTARCIAAGAAVIAIEPELRNFACLQDRVGIVPCYHAAAWSTGGVLRVTLAPDSSAEHSVVADGPGCLVEAIRIDDLPLKGCTFLKIDVEGSECQVLAGADRVLREHRPVVACEVLEANIEALKHLDALQGYRLDFQGPGAVKMMHGAPR